MSFPGGSEGKECLQCGRPGFDPWVEKIPWRRKWQSTPVFLPRESHEQRSLAGYSPWVAKSRTQLRDFTFKVVMRMKWISIGKAFSAWHKVISMCSLNLKKKESSLFSECPLLNKPQAFFPSCHSYFISVYGYCFDPMETNLFLIAAITNFRKFSG